MKANKNIGYVSLTLIIASLVYLFFGGNGDSITEKLEPTCEFCPLQKNDTTIFDTKWQSADGTVFKFERPFRLSKDTPLQNTVVDWKYFNDNKVALNWNLSDNGGYYISKYVGRIGSIFELYFYVNTTKDSLKIICKSGNTYNKNPNCPETTYFKILTE